ncbi:MAG: alpha/beta hydrolase [Elusimicrobiota bacterium]
MMTGKIWLVLRYPVLLMILFYSLVLVFFYVYQARLLFFPDSEMHADPSFIGLDYEKVEISADDGINIYGWYIPCRARRGVLMFCHGNAGNISDRLESCRIFHDIGMEQFIFDYRGYGRSQGSPSEKGMYLDAETVWKYLTIERGIPAEDIIVFGRSLGAAVAVRVAAAERPGALILESCFKSIPDIASGMYPYIPVKLIARYRYRITDHIKHVKSPVLVIHSRDDEIAPYSQGIDVFESVDAPKQFLEIRGGHNDGFIVSKDIYMNGISHFLSNKTGLNEPDKNE